MKDSPKTLSEKSKNNDKAFVKENVEKKMLQTKVFF